MYGTRRIPAAVVHEVFSHLSSTLFVHEAHAFPWYLGQICSEWRAMFLSMQPYFWDEVGISKPSASSKGRLSLKRTMEILSFFLDRTRGAPFSFALHATQLESYIKKEKTYVKTILSKLLDYSVQWKSVIMELRMSEVVLLRGIKNRLPLLQTLGLMVPGRYMSGGNTSGAPLSDIFEDAPHLTNISLYSFCSPALKFNWASLTRIHLLSTDGTEEIISVLRQTVNLTEFTIDEIFYPSQLNVGNTKIVKLPHLKLLSVHGVLLLTVLETPALKELQIKFEEECESEDDPEEPLEDAEVARRTTDFLVRSKCDLSKFTAESLRTSEALESILPYMLNIHDLSIQATYLPNISGVFEWLGGLESGAQATPPPKPPLTRLNVLRILSFFEDHDLKPVKEMIARRNPTAGAIGAGPKELHLNLNGVSRRVTTELDSIGSMCEDRGIDLKFRSWGILTFQSKDGTTVFL